jgi:hypothetical protein
VAALYERRATGRSSSLFENNVVLVVSGCTRMRILAYE